MVGTRLDRSRSADEQVLPGPLEGGPVLLRRLGPIRELPPHVGHPLTGVGQPPESR